MGNWSTSEVKWLCSRSQRKTIAEPGIKPVPPNSQDSSQSAWPSWDFLTYSYYSLLMKPFICDLYLIQIPEQIDYTCLIILLELTLSLIHLIIHDWQSLFLCCAGAGVSLPVEGGIPKAWAINSYLKLRSFHKASFKFFGLPAQAGNLNSLKVANAH